MPKKTKGVTFEQVVKMATAFPGVEETSSFGTPALKVKGKFMARLREPDVMVLKHVEDDEQQFLMGTQPDVFFLTDHYRGWPGILIRLSKVHPDEMRGLIEQSWRRLAPKRLLAESAVAGRESSGTSATAAQPRSRRRRTDDR